MVSASPSSQGSSFRLPMLLLPASKRDDLQTLYGFCRAVDDAVDDAATPEQALANIAFWEHASRAIFDDTLPVEHSLIGQMRAAHHRRGFKPEHIAGLLASMRMDAEGRMLHPSLALLKEYCYGAASCVGLLSMRIFGVAGEDADAFAYNLGMAMQMTNILRDIEVDARNGRVYLPESMNFYALHAYATVFYAAAFDHSRKLPSRRIAPALAMRDVYAAYHRHLELNGFQPPADGRITLGFGEKLRIGARAFGYLISR
ncbi:MAG: hypothetical protein FJX23_05500 [Alphaproteobacteria bacterium]|nr:hypothetical protein [Alphaproteobacteria bacterium]